MDETLKIVRDFENVDYILEVIGQHIENKKNSERKMAFEFDHTRFLFSPESQIRIECVSFNFPPAEIKTTELISILTEFVSSKAHV